MSKKAFKVDNSLVFRPNTEPTDPQNGEMYYDSSSKRPRIRVRDSWVDINPSSLLFKVDQTNSFQLRDAVYWDGSIWQLAKADSSTTLATHVVSYKSESDPDVFELCSIGRIDYGSASDTGKSVGQYYFLSDRHGADFIIKDTPLSTNVTINGIVYNVTGTTVATKLTNLTAIINAISGYRGTGYGDVVAIETPSSISISSQDNAIISVSSATTRLGYATPVKPSFGYDNSLFFVESKNALVYNCYRPVALGGISATSSSGTLDTSILHSLNFEESKLSDFVQTGLILTNSSPIHGQISALLVHQSSIAQSFKKSVVVDRAFRGKKMLFRCLAQSTADNTALKLTLRNETTSTNILTDELINHTTINVTGLSVSSGSNLISGFSLPEPLNSLEIGCRVTGPNIPPNTFITAKNIGALTATMSNLATASGSLISLDFSGIPSIWRVIFDIPYSCETLSYTITGAADTNYTESYIDDIAIELSETEGLDVVVDIPNLSEWDNYTAIIDGFGTVADLNFKWRQVGENIEILGNFTCGTPTSDEARVYLPNSLLTVGAPILTSTRVIGSCSDSSSQVAIEPNVDYLFFVEYSDTSSLARQSGDSMASAGQPMSFFASIPCAGLSATNTSNIVAKEIEVQTNIAGTSFDFLLGKMLSKSISANTAFSFLNTHDGQVRILMITNTSALNTTITFPSGKWPGASPIVTCFGSSTTILTVVVADGTYYYSTVTDLR